MPLRRNNTVVGGFFKMVKIKETENMGKTIVIEIPLEQLLESGKDTIVIKLDGLTEGSKKIKGPDATGFFAFMDTVISQLKERGKERTAEAYRAAKNSLGKYCHGEDFCISDLDSQTIEGYEAWLCCNDVKQNSRSFYMRVLKAAYNKAVRQKMIADKKPFKRVFTGNAKTEKRAVGIETIRRLEVWIPKNDFAGFARDMFLFSFYTRGMSFVDMAFLRKSDLHDGHLTYCRHKTGQQLSIKWESAMQNILERYPSANDKFLLPIIRKSDVKERGQYRHCQRRINEELRTISKQMGLQRPLTMYVARHSWASIARDIEAPISVISQGMGHDSERTTQIYLKEIDNGKIDALNRKIIEHVAI